MLEGMSRRPHLLKGLLFGNGESENRKRTNPDGVIIVRAGITWVI